MFDGRIYGQDLGFCDYGQDHDGDFAPPGYTVAEGGDFYGDDDVLPDPGAATTHTLDPLLLLG